MNLDIRYPIGLLFVIVGAIITGCGIFLPPEAASHLLFGTNVNISWGLVQVAFGAIMLALVRIDAAKKDRKP
jgi:hypothetical protein